MSTNADRIRSMTDEELAKQLVNIQIAACTALIIGLDDKEMLSAYVEEIKQTMPEMIQEQLSWLKIGVEE